MKKLLLISMILLSLVLAGCQKDEPKEETTSDNLTNQTEQSNEDSLTPTDTIKPQVDEESRTKIKELESKLENNDKQIEELNTKVDSLTDELNKKKESEKPQVKPTSTSSSKTYYRVVAGSYTTKENANKKVTSLKAKGFDAFILSSNNKFRVIAGTYSKLNNANIKKDMLKKSGFESFVIK
ncbi:MAG: SPOR domain-containing protein [Vallitalea sp.]|nr:SPOR domain-containing protein [Vallitalea sp.]